MAQIRSKQIADFLTTVNWTNVNATDIASGLAVKNYISAQVAAVNGNTNDLSASVDSLEVALSAEIYDARLYTSDEMQRATVAEGFINGSIDSLEVALSAEISAKNADFTSVDARISTDVVALANEVTRAESVEALLRTDVNSAQAEIDAILLASDADKDTFVEIVSLINAVDLTNDDALAAVILDLNAEISATNSDFVRVEGALSAEISATNADVTSIDARLGNVSGNLVDSVDSLELALSAEISATDADFTSVDARVSGETSRAIAAEGSLENVISDINTSLYDQIILEETRALDAELVLTNDLSALSTELVDEVASIDTRLGSVGSSLVDSVDSLELALSAEISATDADFTSVDARISTDIVALANEVTRAESVEALLSAEIIAEHNEHASTEAVLDGKISTEKGRIDAILLAADADKDTFVEIVSLINAVDLTNDNALAAVILDLNSEISATNSDFVRVEAALSAEISATNADVTSIDTRLGSVSGNLVDSVDSLELALSTEIFNMSDYVDGEVSILEAAISAEISATNSDFVRVEANLSTEIADMTTYVDGEVTSLETAHDSRLDALEGYIMEDVQMVVKEVAGDGLSYTLDFAIQDDNKDLANVYVNGHRVKVASVTGTAIVLATPGYTIDEDDTVVFVYQK